MNLFLHFLVFWHFYLTYVLSCLCGFPSKFSDFWIKTVKKQAVFQILVTYAFTQNGICTVRHSRELWKCRRKKNLRRIFRSKTYHNLINVAWLFDGKTHVFVLKSVVVCGTDPHKRLCDLHQYKCVCVNEIYNLRAEKLTVTLFWDMRWLAICRIYWELRSAAGWNFNW